MVYKIRVFRGLRNNWKDPAEFLKALEWAYCLDYKQEEPGKDKARKESREETMKIIFSSHLSRKAEDWYDNLEVEEKSSWPTLVKHFQTYYQLIPRDTRTKLFDLKMKLADFKQQTDKNIADYFERAANLVTKFPTEEFDIGMATVRGINDREMD